MVAFSRIRERFLEKDRHRQAKEAEQPRDRGPEMG
jgi:hypothetical protein